MVATSSHRRGAAEHRDDAEFSASPLRFLRVPRAAAVSSDYAEAHPFANRYKITMHKF